MANIKLFEKINEILPSAIFCDGDLKVNQQIKEFKWSENQPDVIYDLPHKLKKN